MMGVTGKPSSATRMAGASTSAKVIVPNLSSRAAHPATAPGTVTDPGPLAGTSTRPAAASASRDMPDPDRPLESSPTSRPSSADHSSANMSPPIPVMCGSTTFSIAAAATAASTAFPPRSITEIAARLASG